MQYAGHSLKVVPQEILEKDYGCGDPSAWVNEGDTVLDLGSGAGKRCYIMSQVVGPRGHVIGVDCNADMLKLSRKYHAEVAGRIGYSNVDFRYGLIQDLQLNLVRQRDRCQPFAEIFRVLKRGGRAVISDIVSDETVPDHMQQDGYLWSGCLSGAFRKDLFPEAFAEAGFHGITIAKRQAEPWQTIEGIEFRSKTVMTWNGKDGPCLERHQAVVYKGPFRRVEDDDEGKFSALPPAALGIDD